MWRTLAFLVIPILVAGCVRAGFALPEAGGDREGGVVAPGVDMKLQGDALTPPALDGPPAGEARATKANDTCDRALPVSLASLQGGGTVTLVIDTSGAASDQETYGCAGLADVVVAFSGADNAMMHCSGNGLIAAYNSGMAACGSNVGSLNSTTCQGTSQSLNLLRDRPTKVIFCRDPRLGPATLTLSRFGG